jgi:hypothetical protein
VNQSLYDTFLSPWMRAFANEPMAKALRALSPSRLQRYALSDLNPAMWTVKTLAETVRRSRKPVPADNAYRALETQASERIEQGLEQYRVKRDNAQESLFRTLYGAPWLRAALGPAAREERAAPAQLRSRRAKGAQDARVADSMEAGGFLEGWARIAAYVGKGNAVDERPYRLMRR